MNLGKFLISFAYVGFWKGFCREILLVAELLFILGILTGAIGESNGVRLLFWHESWNTQFMAGLATSLLFTKLFFIGYVLHAHEAEAWAKYLPSNQFSKTMRETLGFVFGCWCIFGFLALGYFGEQFVSKALNRVRSEQEIAASLKENAIRIVTHAPTKTSRTVEISKWAFVAGGTVGIFVLTPAIGVLLFAAARRFRLSRLFGRDENEAHGVGIALVAFMVLSYAYCLFAILWEELNLWTGWYTPAAGLCLLLGLAAAFYGFARFQIRNPHSRLAFALSHPVMIGAVLVLAIWIGGSSHYKFRFEDLAPYYPTDVATTSETPFQTVTTYSDANSDPSKPSHLIPTVERLAFSNQLSPTEDGKRPLILVCVSGGGIRAAVWTAAILSELESQWPEFPYHIKLISGASGGMVGAGYYVSSLLPPNPDETSHRRNAPVAGKRWHHTSLAMDKRYPLDLAASHEDFVDHLAEDMLSPVVKGMIFRDMPMAFLPWSSHLDRGGLLEDTWRHNMGSAWGVTFGQLAVGERERWRPSLVYSPMLVEDGRRLLISNVDLKEITTSYGAFVTETEPYLYSRSAYEFFKLIPQSEERFRLATAARMSASFPYFSPAGVLPTNPRRRVVDAGYFDNYGVTLAANWLNDVLSNPAKREALKANVSGVVVFEIRDGLRERDGEVEGLGEQDDSTRFSRGIEGLTTPPSALLAARDSVSLFRNDEKLAALSNRFRSGMGSDFFTNVSFQYPGEAPLSWYLTKAERDNLKESARYACSNLIAREFRKWLHRHSIPDQHFVNRAKE